MMIAEKLLQREEKLAVVGLGYVGLPLAVAFAKKVQVVGYDINDNKIGRYQRGTDLTNEVGAEELLHTTVEFTADEIGLREAGFVIVAVPTPVDKNNFPDLSPLIGACKTIGKNLRRGAVVMFESTVYPGTTEEICIPILEQTSGLACGSGFSVGYSPERVNPGDRVHRLDNIPKIVSGIDRKTAEEAAKVYELIVKAGTYIAGSIKVAETAKLAENAQRDVNIAFMNELSVTLDRMHIRTEDVIRAMNTKWNALDFHPGLVGGHCISVDPYYLIQKAEEVNGSSDLVQISRKVNNRMGDYVADAVVKQLIQAGKQVKGSTVYIMGVTYKENCPDIRNTMVPKIAARLREYDIGVQVSDPVADGEEVFRCLGFNLADGKTLHNADCVVFAVAHQAFRDLSPDTIAMMYRDAQEETKLLMDVTSMFSKEALTERGFLYWSL